MDAYIEASLAFWRIVTPLVFAHGASVISGRRTVAHNEEVGGVRGSLHIAGCAGDFQFDDDEGRLAFAAACTRAGLDVVVKPASVHVELDIKSALNRR